jgi:hypothetical protein
MPRIVDDYRNTIYKRDLEKNTVSVVTSLRRNRLSIVPLSCTMHFKRIVAFNRATGYFDLL